VCRLQEEDEDNVIQRLPAVVWRVGALQEAAPGFDTSLLRSSHATCRVLICLFLLACRLLFDG
jgi:hypothetical protein